MTEQIVSITDLQEYDNNIRGLISNINVKNGNNSSVDKLKLSVVSSFPLSPDANTLYIIPTGTTMDISQIPYGNIKIGNVEVKSIYIGGTRIW